MKNLLVIEDQTIRTMMQDPRIMQLLPCLTGPKNKLSSTQKGGSNCTRCKYEKQRIRKAAMQSAVSCVQSARGGQLLELKKLLQVKNIRIVTKNANGQMIKYTL